MGKNSRWVETKDHNFPFFQHFVNKRTLENLSSRKSSLSFGFIITIKKRFCYSHKGFSTGNSMDCLEYGKESQRSHHYLINPYIIYKVGGKWYIYFGSLYSLTQTCQEETNSYTLVNKLLKSNQIETRKFKWLYQNTVDKSIFFIYVAYVHDHSLIPEVIDFNPTTILGTPSMCNSEMHKAESQLKKEVQFLISG